MRSLPTSVADLLAARQGRIARLLLWVEARDRDSGDTVPMGFWTGVDHQDFVIGADLRSYFGAGSLVSMDALTSDIGLTVRQFRAGLAPSLPEVQQLVRGYDVRLASCQVHVADFDPHTNNLLAEPVRVFRGWVDQVHISEPAPGGEASCELTMLSAAQALTRRLARKRSDQTLRARASADGFRKYADISGSVETVWGERRANQPTNTTAATTSDPDAPAGWGDWAIGGSVGP